MDEIAIMFTDEDAKRVHHPHDVAIVITLLITDYMTRRVLVDNGSSTDILYYPAFQQMKFGRDQLCPVCSPLVGFGGIKVQPLDNLPSQERRISTWCKTSNSLNDHQG